MTSKPIQPCNSALAAHVLKGLSKPQKALSSSWFYDDAGSRLFEQIMALPEYYPTRTEAQILHEKQDLLVRWITRTPAQVNSVCIIELGCGNGEKSLGLMQALQAIAPLSVYHSMDLSAQALDELSLRFATYLPGFQVRPVLGNYLLDWPDLSACEQEHQVVLFMGSNLGNFPAQSSQALLKRLRSKLKPGAGLVLGLDLQKDPATILAAYNDKSGVTAAFNLNLLRRLNRELGMNFQLEHFKHYASYSPLDGVAQSFIVSTCAQSVRSTVLNTEFKFATGEAIYTEQSQKYTTGMIAQMAADAGFDVKANLTDAKNWYSVSLLEAA